MIDVSDWFQSEDTYTHKIVSKWQGWSRLWDAAALLPGDERIQAVEVGIDTFNRLDVPSGLRPLRRHIVLLGKPRLEREYLRRVGVGKDHRGWGVLCKWLWDVSG